MEITDVKITKVTDKGRLKAYASCILNDCICIRNMRIVQGKSRIFLAMPATKNAEGIFMDLVFPINQDIRNLFETKILEEYQKN